MNNETINQVIEQYNATVKNPATHYIVNGNFISIYSVALGVCFYQLFAVSANTGKIKGLTGHGQNGIVKIDTFKDFAEKKATAITPKIEAEKEVKYYEVVAMIKSADWCNDTFIKTGKIVFPEIKEILFGSFDRSDCKYEIEAERESWKDQGYKKIKIESRLTTETPDPEVYDNFVTADIVESYIEDLEQGLLCEWIEDTYITKSGNGYFVNDNQLLSDIKKWEARS